jgi:hypothetical protein
METVREIQSEEGIKNAEREVQVIQREEIPVIPVAAVKESKIQPEKTDAQKKQVIERGNSGKKFTSVTVREENPANTVIVSEREEDAQPLEQLSYKSIMALYHYPEFRAQYEDYKDYNYENLFDRLYQDIVEGKMTVEKLEIRKYLTFVLLALMKVGLAIFKLDLRLGGMNSKDLLKSVINIIRAEDSIRHVKRQIQIFDRVITIVQNDPRVLRRQKSEESKEKKIVPVRAVKVPSHPTLLSQG